MRMSVIVKKRNKIRFVGNSMSKVVREEEVGEVGSWGESGRSWGGLKGKSFYKGLNFMLMSVFFVL